MGTIENGIAAMAWSPDFEIVVFVTRANTLLLMTQVRIIVNLFDLVASGDGWNAPWAYPLSRVPDPVFLISSITKTDSGTLVIPTGPTDLVTPRTHHHFSNFFVGLGTYYRTTIDCK